MPGNTLRFASTPIEAGKLLFASFGGFGVLGSELPTTGDQGPSFLLDDLDPGDENTEIRARITELPSAGTFDADEFGAFSLVGAPAGTYTFKYVPIVGVTELGEATETIVIGSTPVACDATLQPPLWAGTVQLATQTPVAFDAALTPFAWQGPVSLNAQTAATFAAALQPAAWAGVVQLQSITPAAFAAALSPVTWSGSVSLDGTTDHPREFVRLRSPITLRVVLLAPLDLETP